MFLKPTGLSATSVASTNPTEGHSTREPKILLMPRGKWHYDRKHSNYGGQTKPYFYKKAKTTKNAVLGFNALSPTAELREGWLLRDASRDSWPAQSVERATLDLGVVSLSPTSGLEISLKKKKKKKCKPSELGGDGRERVKRSSSKLCILLYYEDNKILRLCSEKFKKWKTTTKNIKNH